MITPLFSEVQRRRLNIDGFKDALRNKLGGMVRATKYIRAGNRIYRGVVCAERPDVISRVSFPPPEKVVRWGRLNRPRESVFYGSAAPPGVFYELKAHVGSRIAFSHWEVMGPLWMHNLGYHADALARLGAAPSDPRLTLTEPIANETRRNRLLRRQVALAFTEDIPEDQEHRYQQSVAIKEFWCEHRDALEINPDGPQASRVAGIVYPSLQMRGDADNVAIWPEFIFSSLRLRQVQYVLVEKADPGGLAFTFLTLAVSKGFAFGTKIFWRDELPPETERRCHIALEGNTWIQRGGFTRMYSTNAEAKIVGRN